MWSKLFISVLVVIALLMGIQYAKRQFNIGPGLPALSASWWQVISLDYLRATTNVPSPSPMLPEETASPSTVVVKTYQQRVGALLAVPLKLDASGIASGSVSLDFVRQYEPSVVVLFGSDIPATTAAAVTSKLRELSNPPLIAVDHEGGTTQRLRGAGFTTLPSWRQLCAEDDALLQQSIASAAAQLRSAGVDVVLGPVVDRAASGSALRSRACASDPKVIARKAKLAIEAYQAEGVATVLKHYPGIGSARTDLHTSSALVSLEQADTQSFEAILDQNSQQAVMVSQLRIAQTEPEVPCLYSTLCVGELRRVYPEAFLISDALEMKAGGYQGAGQPPLELPLRAEQAIRTGIDLLLFGPTVTEQDLRAVASQLERAYVVNGQLQGFGQRSADRATRWRDRVLLTKARPATQPASPTANPQP